MFSRYCFTISPLLIVSLLLLAATGCSPVSDVAREPMILPSTAPTSTASSPSAAGEVIAPGEEDADSTAATEADPPIELPDLGPAPPIASETWLNTEEKISWDELRGKVVLVEFWTFGCINCKRVIPHLREWYDTYRDKGFEIIGVHYPEFGYEEKLENVIAAAAELDVRYPIAIDNEGHNWRAYNQRFWPTLYLVDTQGRIRYTHIGEGAYAQTEAAINRLLARLPG